jgi:transcriptional regulator with XRE-family HTH domain
MTAIGQLIQSKLPTKPVVLDLARRVGVSGMTVRNWIDGVHVPPCSRLPLLAAALGVELSKLEQLVEADRAARGQGDENGSQASGAAHAGQSVEAG